MHHGRWHDFTADTFLDIAAKTSVSLQNSNFLMAVSYKYFFPSIGGNFTVQTIAGHFGHKLNFVLWTHPIPLWITRVNDLTQTVQKKLDRLTSPSTRIPSKDFILQYKINGKRTHFTWSICLWKLRKIMTVSFHKKCKKIFQTTGQMKTENSCSQLCNLLNF